MVKRFTPSADSCYIAPKPRGPVLKNTLLVAFATPIEKRGFVVPKLLGQVRSHASVRQLWGMVGAIRKDVRTATDVFLTTMLHPMRSKTQMVVSLNPVGTKTMTVSTKVSRRAAPATSATGTPDPIQLHADARNALSMAVFYLSQPQANVAGARRKAVQALSALRGLDLRLEG